MRAFAFLGERRCFARLNGTLCFFGLLRPRKGIRNLAHGLRSQFESEGYTHSGIFSSIELEQSLRSISLYSQRLSATYSSSLLLLPVFHIAWLRFEQFSQARSHHTNVRFEHHAVVITGHLISLD